MMILLFFLSYLLGSIYTLPVLFEFDPTQLEHYEFFENEKTIPFSESDQDKSWITLLDSPYSTCNLPQDSKDMLKSCSLSTELFSESPFSGPINHLFATTVKGDLGNIKHLLNSHHLDGSLNENKVFQIASEYGHLNILNYLVSLNNTELDPSSNHNYAFIHAAKEGHVDVLKFLSGLNDTRIDPCDLNNRAFVLSVDSPNVKRYLLQTYPKIREFSRKVGPFIPEYRINDYLN